MKRTRHKLPGLSYRRLDLFSKKPPPGPCSLIFSAIYSASEQSAQTRPAAGLDWLAPYQAGGAANLIRVACLLTLPSPTYIPPLSQSTVQLTNTSPVSVVVILGQLLLQLPYVHLLLLFVVHYNLLAFGAIGHIQRLVLLLTRAVFTATARLVAVSYGWHPALIHSRNAAYSRLTN